MSKKRTIVCTACDAKLALPEGFKAAAARCPKCQTYMEIPTETPPPEPSPAQSDHSDLLPEDPPKEANDFSDLFPDDPPAGEAGDDIEFEFEEPAPTRLPKGFVEPESESRKPVSDRSPWIHAIFAVTLLPLIWMIIFTSSDVEERFISTIDNHPEILEGLESGRYQDMEDILNDLPGHRIEGAHLPTNTFVHWIYALVATGAFIGALLLLFERGDARLWHFLKYGGFVGTGGIILLLIIQQLAGRVIGGGPIGIFLMIIGFSYRAALDPETGFIASMMGYTFGIGLCEEFVKSIPMLLHFRRDAKFGWRAASVLGLACGFGFGIAEGIMYSSDFYNGIHTGGVYLVRFASCVALHGVWSGTVGMLMYRFQYIVHDEMDWGDRFNYLLYILAGPMFLHGLYDTFLKRDMPIGALVTALASYGLFIWLMHHLRHNDPWKVEAPAAV